MRERKKIKKKSTDIHKSTLAYRITKVFSDFSTRMSYMRSEISGLENIPEDGIIILAPNHCNTLIDALHILRMRKEQTVYGARADLFNKPALAKVLRFLKILPVARVRDGLTNVTKNYETMAEAYTVLGEGVPFCIFPEGTHRPMHSLLPLKKGVFRMAMEVCSLYPDRTVYVVPCGLEYGDYFRYGSSILIQVGEPLNVTEYLAQHQDCGDAANYRALLADLTERISKLITYIPDDENYSGTWAYTRLMTAGPKPFSLKARLEDRRRVVDSVVNAPEEQRETVAAKLAAADDFDKKRKAAGISFHSLGYQHPVLRLLAKTVLSIICLPALLNLAVFAIPELIVNQVLCTKMIKDRAFRNSVRDVVNLILSLLISIITLITSLCCGVGICNVLVLTATAFLAPYLTYWAKEWFRIWISDLKLLFRSDIRSAFASLKQ